MLLTTIKTDVPADLEVSGREQRHYLAGGQLHAWRGPVKEVFSSVRLGPAGARKPVRLGSFPLMDKAAALQALDAAVHAYGKGQGEWPAMSVRQRIGRMELFVELMSRRRQEVTRLIMWEIAKPIKDCEKEFDRTVDYIRATITALKDSENESARFPIVEGTLGHIRRCSLGVVLCMGPYNYPLNETFTTLIPALIMGNTVVLKPPKLGVLCYEPLLEAFRTAFPPGVVNTVYGEGEDVVPPIMESGLVNVLALIGSSRVADKIKKMHPKSNRLRAVLGLDAKNPAIILEDADLDVAVSECLAGSLTFNGQRCTALKVLFVHRSVADTFANRLAAAVDQLKIGMPWTPGVQITHVAEASRPGYLAACVEDALQKGASVLNHGGGQCEDGLFVPAVLYPVRAGMRIYDEEQFGPVVPVVPFDDVNEVIDYVLDSHYGQQISLFGQDPERLGALIDVLVSQVCRVNLNCQCQRSPDAFPFSGRKDSAESTLSVSDALRVFSIRSMVAAKNSAKSQELVSAILHGRHSKFVSTDYLI